MLLVAQSWLRAKSQKKSSFLTVKSRVKILVGAIKK